MTRDDGETVGHLEPVTTDYATVLPRSVLGHAVGEPCPYLEGEELLLERGIGELMNGWKLRDAPEGLSGTLAIIEVSARGIVVADALATKALVPTQRSTVPWPDTEHRLSGADR